MFSSLKRDTIRFNAGCLKEKQNWYRGVTLFYLWVDIEPKLHSH